MKIRDVLGHFVDIYLVPFYLFSLLFLIVCKPHIDYPEETILTALLKILPIISLAGFIYLKFQQQKISDGVYGSFIIYGLLVSALGDICLVWRDTLFLPGVFFFAIAHVFYILGLMTKYTKSEYKSIFVYISIASFLFVAEGLDSCFMKFSVFLYSFLISGVAFLGVARFENESSMQAKFAAIGGLLFMISDFIIAVDRWRFGILASEFFVMVTYFSAQVCLALSAIDK